MPCCKLLAFLGLFLNLPGAWLLFFYVLPRRLRTGGALVSWQGFIPRPKAHQTVKGPQQTKEDLCKLDKSPPNDPEDLYRRPPEPVSQLCCNIKDILTSQSHSPGLDRAIQDWQHDQLQHDHSDSYLFSLVQQLNERAFLFLRDAKLRQSVNLNGEQDQNGNEEGCRRYPVLEDK